MDYYQSLVFVLCIHIKELSTAILCVPVKKKLFADLGL